MSPKRRAALRLNLATIRKRLLAERQQPQEPQKRRWHVSPRGLHAEIVARLQAGQKPIQVVRDLGVSRSVVGYLIKKHGFSFGKHQRMTDTQKARIRKMFQNGFGRIRIARALDVPTGTVGSLIYAGKWKREGGVQGWRRGKPCRTN